MERGLLDQLVLMRAVHFAATISVAGVVFFSVFVCEPAFRVVGENGPIPAIVRAHLARTAWIGLALVVATGAGWLVLQAEQMSELSLMAVFSQGIAWSVLSDTEFGNDWTVRFALAVLLAGASYWFFSGKPLQSHGARAIVVALAAGLVGTLAFAGHAAAGSGIEGAIHLTSDILHLVAAAAWVGALLPLGVLLGAAHRTGDPPSMAIAREAILRFSKLGIVSVCALLATGIVNSWVLVGGMPALLETDYGRLLLVKVALFFFMLSIAAVNRLWFTPQLVQEQDSAAAHDSARQLRKNSMIEAGAGAVILGIVAVLGTLSPGLDEQAKSRHRYDNLKQFSAQVTQATVGGDLDVGTRSDSDGSISFLRCHARESGHDRLVGGFPRSILKALPLRHSKA
jgi:putative copper resistance protein D